MRRLLLVLGLAAAASAAHAQAAPPCPQSLFHPRTCRTAPSVETPKTRSARQRPAAPRPVAAAPKPPPARPASTLAPRPRAPEPRPAAAQAAPPAVDAVDPRFVEPYACNFAEKVTLGPAVCSARHVAELRREVSNLVHQGRCDEAVRTARDTGDQAFAGRVGEYCQPRPR